MSPFKRAVVKGGSNKGKEHVIDVDDLSLGQKGPVHHQECMIQTSLDPMLLF